MRRLVDPVLVALSPRFQRLYARMGRPSIPPEQLLRALLLQVLYTICSERLLMEQLDYNLLYRGFVGLSPDDPVWVPTVFTKNRDRLLAGEIAEAFFAEVRRLAAGTPCCPRTTLRSMARCWKRGRATRAAAPWRTRRRPPTTTPAIPASTSAASGARMRRTGR
jgi:hypothetical protein